MKDGGSLELVPAPSAAEAASDVEVFILGVREILVML